MDGDVSNVVQMNEGYFALAGQGPQYASVLIDCAQYSAFDMKRADRMKVLSVYKKQAEQTYFRYSS